MLGPWKLSRSGGDAAPLDAGEPDQLHLLTLPQLRATVSRPLIEAAIRGRCTTVPVDAHTVLCRVLGRYKFFVDSRDTGFAPHLMLDGFWEYWVSDFMWRNLEPGQTAYDVGANHGYYSVLLGDLVGSGGRLRAFEPNPRLADLLRRNLSINGLLRADTVSEAAVTQESGNTVSFVASLSDPKNGHIAPAAVPDRPDLLQVTVPTLCLDDFAGERVDFIKVDVEGAEEMVWAGMQRLLDGSPGVRILFEFNASRCADADGLLAGIRSRFPLRFLDTDAQVKPCTADYLLGQSEDVMLFLHAD
ncbi:FkbM family methyltransferase [Roseomonas sp. BN140053]|uniref:FkbM family methyltransferase n=1 Tax=Roseomonas sp. BN140053 TaxID=3391898 RepID=UPI0039E7368B